jgi:hypothetical protein
VELEPEPVEGAAAVGAMDDWLAGRAGTRRLGLITIGIGGGGDGVAFLVSACGQHSKSLSVSDGIRSDPAHLSPSHPNAARFCEAV